MVYFTGGIKIRTKLEIGTQFGSRSELDGRRNLFLLGIGGAGMSPLAELAVKRGYIISGVDSADSETLTRLRGLGIEVAKLASYEAPNFDKNIEGLVISDAIDIEADKSVLEARKIGIPIFRRSQLLGSLLKDHRLIAITGTHGKTTTTGLVATALKGAGLDPLAVVGAVIPDWKSPLLLGKSDWAVAEACEAYDGIQDLSPEVIVLTNLELDHEDFHLNYENLKTSMIRFVNSLPEKGFLVYNAEDAGAVEVAEAVNKLSFGYKTSEFEGVLGIFGDHNRSNASGAAKTLFTLKSEFSLALDEKKGISSLASYKGAERRLQEVFNEEITVVDDYAHTSAEIVASIQGLREAYPNRRLVVVYQPHLYSRTAGSETQFAEALSKADFVFLTDIYPAREAPMPGVSSAVISDQISVPNRYVPNRHLLPRKVLAFCKRGDVIVGMGAGSIAEFVPSFVDAYLHRNRLTAPYPLGRKIKVVVAVGGDSSEREVSLHSGLAIHNALISLNYDSEMVDVSDDLLSGKLPLSLMRLPLPDVVFLGVHGCRAEDGAIQGFLELLHIPYTGSGIKASAIAMDKNLTKEILNSVGVRTPKGFAVKQGDPKVVEFILDQIGLPVVVKPNEEGSTVGVTFVHEESRLIQALEKGWSFGEEVIVEELLVGMEVSTPVLNGVALLPVEIAPNSGVYDFSSKYTPGATSEIVPARISQHLIEECQKIALKAHNALHCEGATRTDMFVCGNDVIVIEVNTLPGMTQTSLLPRSASEMGIPFPELCRQILEDALSRHAKKI